MNIPFFRQPHVIEVIKRTLTIWTLEHTRLDYQQGMHEIIAMLYLVLWNSSFNLKDINIEDPQNSVFNVPSTNSSQEISNQQDHLLNQSYLDSLLLFILDDRYIEHALYALFDALMNTIGFWFFDPVYTEQVNERKRTEESSTTQVQNLSTNQSDIVETIHESSQSKEPTNPEESELTPQIASTFQTNTEQQPESISSSEHKELIPSTEQVQPSQNPSDEQPSSTSSDESTSSTNSILNADSVHSFSSIDSSTQSSVLEGPLVIRDCNRVEAELEETNPELMQILHQWGLSVQIFALRWIRMLFLREYSEAITLCLWDAFFALNHPYFEKSSELITFSTDTTNSHKNETTNNNNANSGSTF